MDIKHILKHHAYLNIPITYDEAYCLGNYALRGCAGESLALVQSIAALSALHTQATYGWRKETKSGFNGHLLPLSAAEQIAGICASVFENDIAKTEFGFLKPDVGYAMDNCGMGGDLIVTANVSTLAAFIAAAAGIPMCKHGSPANADQGRHGSSDFMSFLGIETTPATKGKIERCLEVEHFCFIESGDTRFKRIHFQTDGFAKLPHMNDIIGPITNPLLPRLMTRRVLGVNHLISPDVVADAYRELNARGITDLRHGLFVRGFADSSKTNGMDEVSICPGGTQVAELHEGAIREFYLYAEDFGLGVAPLSSISPPEGMTKGDFSLGILKGEIAGPPLDMVLANAALLFYLDGRSSDLAECTALAREIHESGQDYEKVQTLTSFMSA